jgi:hypothetical protein
MRENEDNVNSDHESDQCALHTQKGCSTQKDIGESNKWDTRKCCTLIDADDLISEQSTLTAVRSISVPVLGSNRMTKK